MTSGELPTRLMAALAERIIAGRPTILSLVGDPMAFRFAAVAGLKPPPVTLCALANHELPWKSVGRVSRLLGGLSDGPGPVGGNHGWAKALLPFLAAFAGQWAARLAEQMGGRSALPFCENSLGPRFRARFNACLHDAQQARRLVTRIDNSLIEGFKCPPDGDLQGERPGMLRLQSHGDGIHVTWLSQDGRELCRETLYQLARRACGSRQVLGLLDEAQRIHARQEEHRAVGDAQLRAACPQLAEAVASALEKNRCVGHWIVSAGVRGLPAEVYLFVDPTMPGQRYPRVSLVARRAHEEFVLGNAEGQRFYFPPIQLSAQIDFTAANPPWCVLRPYVRMPPDKPPWRHPYTGSLKMDPFGQAELPLGCWGEAMVAISDAARRLLPSLAADAFSHHAGISDLCLRGQDLRINRLVEQTCPKARRRQADPLTLVQGLWDIVRIGLCRAHQNNTHMPRASLTEGSMCHPIGSWTSLGKTRLAERFFPYNARGSAR